MMGYRSVYFITETGGELCKVGCASDPFRRLYALQIGNPREIGIVEIIYVRSFLHVVDRWRVDERGIKAQRFREIAEADAETSISWVGLEKELHERYDAAGLRHRGEWFSGGMENLVGIAKGHLKEVYPSGEFFDFRSMRRKVKLMRDEAAIIANRAESSPVRGRLRLGAQVS